MYFVGTHVSLAGSIYIGHGFWPLYKNKFYYNILFATIILTEGDKVFHHLDHSIPYTDQR